MENPRIMVLRPLNLPLKHQDAKMIYKLEFLIKEYFQVALTQIDNEESNNHGAKNSFPTLEKQGY